VGVYVSMCRKSLHGCVYTSSESGYIFTYMHREFTCVCVYIHAYVHRVYV